MEGLHSYLWGFPFVQFVRAKAMRGFPWRWVANTPSKVPNKLSKRYRICMSLTQDRLWGFPYARGATFHLSARKRWGGSYEDGWQIHHLKYQIRNPIYTKYENHDTKCTIPNTKYTIPNTKYAIQNTKYAYPWGLGCHVPFVRSEAMRGFLRRQMGHPRFLTRLVLCRLLQGGHYLPAPLLLTFHFRLLKISHMQQSSRAHVHCSAAAVLSNDVHFTMGIQIDWMPWREC